MFLLLLSSILINYKVFSHFLEIVIILFTFFGDVFYDFSTNIGVAIVFIQIRFYFSAFSSISNLLLSSILLTSSSEIFIISDISFTSNPSLLILLAIWIFASSLPLFIPFLIPSSLPSFLPMFLFSSQN